ncbi:F-box domain-containing protein [Pleurotus pulmonarius]
MRIPAEIAEMIIGHVDGKNSLKNLLLVSQSSRSLVEPHLYADVSFLRQLPLNDDEWDRLDLGLSARDDTSLQCPKSVLSVGKSFLLSLTTDGGRRAQYVKRISLPSNIFQGEQSSIFQTILSSLPSLQDILVHTSWNSNWVNPLHLRHFFDGSRPSFSLRSFAWLTENVPLYTDGLAWFLSGQTSLESLSLYPSSTRPSLSPAPSLDLASFSRLRVIRDPSFTRLFKITTRQGQDLPSHLHTNCEHLQGIGDVLRNVIVLVTRKSLVLAMADVAAPNLEYLEVDTFCSSLYGILHDVPELRRHGKLRHLRIFLDFATEGWRRTPLVADTWGDDDVAFAFNTLPSLEYIDIRIPSTAMPSEYYRFTRGAPPVKIRSAVPVARYHEEWWHDWEKDCSIVPFEPDDHRAGYRGDFFF